MRHAGNNESGQTLVFSVLIFTSLLLMAGLLIDAGNLYLIKRNTQGAADAGALAGVRELPESTSRASSVATSYVETENSAEVTNISFASRKKITVQAQTVTPGFFLALFDQGDQTVTASATATVREAAALKKMLPFGLMRDSYTLGENIDVRTDSSKDHAGVIYPNTGDTCGGTTSGANDLRDLILTDEHGGEDACAMEIGSLLDVFIGNAAGPTQQGFSGRLSGNTQSIDDVFQSSAGGGPPYIIKDADSPRIGVIPIVENSNGTNTWPKASGEVRIISYVIVYLGKTDQGGYPVVTDSGKDVWFTPIATILPQDFADAVWNESDASLPFGTPVQFTLTE